MAKLSEQEAAKLKESLRGHQGQGPVGDRNGYAQKVWKRFSKEEINEVML